MTDPKPADAGPLPSADVRAIEKEMSAEYDWRDNGSQHYMDDFANRAASLVCSRMQGEIDRLLAVLALMERNEERRDAEIDRLRGEVAELREDRDRFYALADGLLESYLDSLDVDLDCLEPMLSDAGLIERATVTAADLDEEWAQEYDLKIGDPCWKVSALGSRARKHAARQEAAADAE